MKTFKKTILCLVLIFVLLPVNSVKADELYSVDSSSSTYSLSDVGISDITDFLSRIKEVYGKELLPGLNTYSNVSDIAFLCTISVNDGEKGPISIVPATLTKNGTDVPVYLISLGGTEFVDGQATDISTDIKSAFEMDNDYLAAATNEILNNIPKGSNLVITGYSLGGMVAQQLNANSKIKANYNILNVVGVGSPLISPFLREGTVRRMADANDLVPSLSFCSVFLGRFFASETATEDGGYKTFIGAHALSYVDSAVWKDYDVLGYKYGGATISFVTEDIKYFYAPLSE